MPMDAFRKAEDARIGGRGEAYEGPPPPTQFFVQALDGRQFWARWVAEEGMGGTRVRILQEIANG